MNLILCGFQNCGKTTYGKLLAQKSGSDFIDTDEHILALCVGKYNSIKQLCQQEGEAVFRKLEKQVIVALGKQVVEKLDNQGDAVIASGGGSLLDDDNVRHLQKMGKLIYLQLDKTVLWQRMQACGLATFVDGQDAFSSFSKAYNERVARYKEVADYVVPITGKTDDGIIEKLMYIKLLAMTGKY